MQAIFLYGSLMDTEIRRHVFADTVSPGQVRPAVARDHRTLTYPGETFPILVPQPGGLVQGEVLLSPNSEALARMAFYEGDEYGMAALNIELENGQQLTAHYNQASNEELPVTEPWCFHQWQRSERDTLVEMCRQYMHRCWGKMSVLEADAVWQELQSLRA
ncbi:gamma-glutamylcyclotransferase [Aestuariicella hydrocarbonica]|uniref:Putative gamma-glutamylcyclotransferase n=1 Tax=Pseudomaricurvus hydrocarbonicus TaxID=1470433 RepID=A0A9E5JWP0_9GAMM|nr:gamma-glutamylcyclotransferase [Aestuariicella hydrocarbonica]